MRDYAKVSPHFWTGSTGKQLRKCPEALVVAMYLMTCPHANMLGMFYVPLLYIAHETGLGLEGASKGLDSACEAGFCTYDHESEVVWVYEMARYQVADSLKSTDNRCKGIQNEYNSLPSNPYLASFFDKYSKAFCMTEKRANSTKKHTKNEAPLKPLASQEQEQEQEQENIHTNAHEKILEPEVWNPDIEHLKTILQTSKFSQRVHEILSLEEFQFHLGNFNAHHEKNFQLTDNQRHRKFAQWLVQEFEKHSLRVERENKQPVRKTSPQKSVSRNVNDAWGEIPKQEPVSADYDPNEPPPGVSQQDWDENWV